MKRSRLCAWIRSPIKRRIDNHFPSNPGLAFTVAGGGDFAGTVRTEDCGKADAGVLAATDPDIPMIDSRSLHMYHDLAWARRRRWPLLDAKVTRITHFPQDNCAHEAGFYLIGELVPAFFNVKLRSCLCKKQEEREKREPKRISRFSSFSCLS